VVRIIWFGLTLVLVATPLGVPLIGRTPQGAIVITPPRDPVPPSASPRDPAQPTVRRIPVGTAGVSGIVTTADTGRPVRGARVSVNGSTAAASGRLGGVAGMLPGGVPGGVVTTSGGSVTFGGGTVTLSSGGAPGQSTATLGPIAAVASRTTLTDAQGQFVIDKLPAGQYSLTVSRNQFLMTSYGQKKPGGPGSSFQLTDGQKAKVSLQMIRGGVITGMVLGEDGDALSNTQVRAWRYAMSNGVKRLQPAGGASTDDRGVYRLFGLQPGDYLVSAMPNGSDTMMSDRMNAETVLIEQAIASGAVQPGAAPGLPATVAITVPPPQQTVIDGPPPGYLPVYFPSTAVPANATTIHVTGGDERSSIDIQVRLVQASSIQGSVSNPPGQNLSVQVSLMNDDPMAESANSTRIDPTGHFTFRNVAPGKYTIAAQTVVSPAMTIVNGVPVRPGPPPQLDDSQKWWGRAAVSVEGQPTVSVNVALQPPRSVSGVVVFEMARPPDLTQGRLMVTLTPAPGAQLVSFGPPTQAQVGLDGRFVIHGVVPGRYMLRPPGGFAKSAIVNGEDTLDFPLDLTGDRDVTDAVLTVTDKSSEISGTLTDASGKPAIDYTIVAAAADDRFWTPGSRRIGIARLGPDGRYVFRNLPPGAYLLAAVTDLESGGQYDPEFLRTLAGAAAMRVVLTEGAKLTQDLRVGR
jgi:hypothetical protein